MGQPLNWVWTRLATDFEVKIVLLLSQNPFMAIDGQPNPDPIKRLAVEGF